LTEERRKFVIDSFVKFADETLAVADKQVTLCLYVQHLSTPLAPDGSIVLVETSVTPNCESVPELASMVGHDALVIGVLYGFVTVVPVEFGLNILVPRWSARNAFASGRGGSSSLVMYESAESVSSGGSVREETVILAFGRIVFDTSLCVRCVLDFFNQVLVQVVQVYTRVSNVSNRYVLSICFHAQNFMMFMKNQVREGISLIDSLLLVGVVDDADDQFIFFSRYNDSFHHKKSVRDRATSDISNLGVHPFGDVKDQSGKHRGAGVFRNADIRLCVHDVSYVFSPARGDPCSMAHEFA
jgi:hypothetical protein